MTREFYPTEVEVTVNYDENGEVVLCMDLGGEVHVFDLMASRKFLEMLETAIEFAEDVDENGPLCEYDA